MAERADCSWCSSWRRFHGSPDGDADTQSDGYREHYASMADVFTIFAFAAVNASRDDMQTVILCLSSLPAAAAATTLLKHPERVGLEDSPCNALKTIHLCTSTVE